jgi:hypothetical protein
LKDASTGVFLSVRTPFEQRSVLPERHRHEATISSKRSGDSLEFPGNTPPPTVTIGRIRFLRPDVAVVQVSWRFAEGILLAIEERIPSFSQVDTYVVIKSQSFWLVAAHIMQEKEP